jgi:hypothetical protein
LGDAKSGIKQGADMKTPLDPRDSERFQIGDAVRWKKADSTDPRNEFMRIEKIIGQKALCMWVVSRGLIENGIPGNQQMVGEERDWFPLSELEHVLRRLPMARGQDVFREIVESLAPGALVEIGEPSQGR